MTSRSSWKYYRDETNNVNDNASDAKSFKYEIYNYAPGANFMITSTKLYVPVATLYFINK